MTTIVGALRNLYRKLGGTDSGTKTIAGMIDKVADVAGGGSGSCIMLVNAYSQVGQNQYKVDKTFSEVAAHLAADPGNTAVISQQTYGIFQLVTINGSMSTPSRLLFSNAYINGGSTAINTLTWLPSNTDVVTMDTISIGGDGPMVAHMGTDRNTGDFGITDATAGNILSAMKNGKSVVLLQNNSADWKVAHIVYADYSTTAGYTFTIMYGAEVMTLHANKSSDHPMGQ